MFSDEWTGQAGGGAMLTAAQVGELDSRLLRVLDRAATYQPARGLELQALVADAREHLAGGAVSYDSALAIVAAVESRALVLGLLDAAAGSSPIDRSSPGESPTTLTPRRRQYPESRPISPHAGVPAGTSSSKRPATSSATSSGPSTDYAAQAGGGLTVPAAGTSRVALATAGVRGFWDGLSPLGRLAIAGVVVGVGVLAWRRWGPA